MSPVTRILLLAVAVLTAASGFLFTRWQATREDLAVSRATVTAQQETITTLEKSMAATNEAVAGWEKDRTTLANVSRATRAAVKEAFSDATFTAWASGAVPPDVFRLLRDAATASGLAPAPVGTDAAGAGGTHTGTRNKR